MENLPNINLYYVKIYIWGENMKKRIVIDLDGVVFPTQELLCTMVRETTPSSKFSLDRILTYNFNKSLDMSLVPEEVLKRDEYTFDDIEYGLGIPRKDVFALLTSPELFKRLTPYEEVHDALLNFTNAVGDGFEVVFYSLAWSTEILKLKEESIQRYFGDIPNLYYSLIVSSDRVTKPFMSCDYLIEDNPSAVSNVDTKCFLVDKPYNNEGYSLAGMNLKFNDVTRVSSLAEALNLIKSSHKV